jgi:UTP--glucose-1-phosphate uridylyltransferase
MTASLREQLATLPADVQSTLKQYGFDLERFLRLAQRLEPGHSHSNLVTGTLTPPTPEDLGSLPDPASAESQQLEQLGLEALRNGECAMVLLAGGMATRMGGVVKALVEALPGQTFLDLRLNEASTLERRGGQRVPLWLMTSDATDATIRDALGARRDGYYLETFTQQLSVRLTPEGDVFLDSSGRPSLHSPGHGDLPEALKASGLLDKFIARGGKYVTLANIDNLGASLDPRIIGYHIRHGKPLTCEVVDKLGTDKGGIPVRVNDVACVLEEFRIPPSFDPSQVRVFSTNTLHVNADALSALNMQWTYFTVEKKVDGKPTVQFERLVNELTSGLPTQYLHLSRSGASSRFLPVKDFPELEQRQGEITLVARDRGMSQQ